MDRTGLAGAFDFTIEWMPVAPGVLPPTTDAPAQPDAPGFVEALREQLGLKLESTTALVRTSVIDRIEVPSQN